jgi:hypothetical protein
VRAADAWARRMAAERLTALARNAAGERLPAVFRER